MELCDTTPSQVEQSLKAWEGRRFCPWNSYLKSEKPVAGRVASRAPAVAAPIPLAAENFRLQRSDYNPVIANLDGVLPTTGGYAHLRYSAVSLDRTSSPHNVIVPEYNENAAGTRVVRYPLDESTLMLKPEGNGYVHGSEAYQVDIPSMQGATAIGEEFYVSSSRGAGAQGSIYTFTKSSGPMEHAGALPPGPEDFSYWASQDQIWTLAEHPGNRSVLPIKASSY